MKYYYVFDIAFFLIRENYYLQITANEKSRIKLNTRENLYE